MGEIQNYVSEFIIQNYVSEFINTNAWANPVPKLCGCRGHGWWLSELDSWHSCPYHGNDKHGKPIPHPDNLADESFSKQCPYCHTPVVITAESVNGIMPINGENGCKFCNPTDLPF